MVDILIEFYSNTWIKSNWSGVSGGSDRNDREIDFSWSHPGAPNQIWAIFCFQAFSFRHLGSLPPPWFVIYQIWNDFNESAFEIWHKFHFWIKWFIDKLLNQLLSNAILFSFWEKNILNLSFVSGFWTVDQFLVEYIRYQVKSTR